MSLTVMPIRFVLAFSCLVIAWFFAFLVLLGRTKEDAQQPMSGWREYDLHVYYTLVNIIHPVIDSIVFHTETENFFKKAF
jgi:hypothetical protein